MSLHYLENMNMNIGNCLFSYAVYCVLKTTLIWLAIGINQFQ